MQNNLDEIIKKQINFSISKTDFKIGDKYQGKVRDVYDLGDKLIIVTTDRISAFDRVLGTIPFKGEILNELSLFWFDKTKDIIQNHIIKKIHSNAILVNKCKIIPIEIIIRGYLTGSGWRDYSENGIISGIKLPDGLKKDCKFDKPILTPTTKAITGHDMPISVKEIIDQKIISKNLMEEIEDKALKLFNRGQEIANKNNMILVDTKYEFGLLPDNTLIVADEIHTSDCSRYWYLDAYKDLFEHGKEQKMLDKEYLRQWLISKNFKGDGVIPEIPLEIIYGIVSRYVTAFETITGVNYLLENKDSNKTLIDTIENLNI